MRVLLTGAAGFLGGHLRDLLRAQGHAVVAVDLAPAPGIVAADVTDMAAMRAAARGCEAVIHAAALTQLWHPDAGAYDRVNHQGTLCVLQAAAAAGARRAVVVSSFATLIRGRRGDAPRQIDETEELPPESLTGPYPAAKRRAELAALAAPLPTLVVLPTAPIGPGDAAPTPPGRLLCDLALGRVPAMLDCTWDFVDVRAVAASTVAALTRGRPGQRYLLGGEGMETDGFLALFARVSGAAMPRARVPHGLALAVAQAEAALARLTGRHPQAPLTGVRLAGPRLAFDSAKARAELGHDPGPAAQALADALAWFQARGMVPGAG